MRFGRVEGIVSPVEREGVGTPVGEVVADDTAPAEDTDAFPPENR